METKQLEFPLSLGEVAEDGSFSGYASVFDVIDSHNDVVVNGAFKRTLKNRSDVKLLWQHRMDEPIGVINHLQEDDNGLYIEGKLLLDIQRAKESYSLLKSGAINGLSIGYSVVDYDIDSQSGSRVLKDVDLWEVSLVTFPANKRSGVTSLKAGEQPQTIREFEHFLRDAGFSRNEAKNISLSGFPQREADMDEFDVLESTLDRAIHSLT